MASPDQPKVSHPQDQRSVSALRDVLPTGAACRFDPELHDGPGRIETTDERAAREQVAREVCATCPIWDACLDYAVRVRPERGVWTGFTAEELAALAAFAEALEPAWTLSGEVA